MVRVLVVDSHPLMRVGFSEVLKSDISIQIIGEAENAQEAVRKINTLRPDVVLLDVLLLQTPGLNVLEAIKKINPHIKVIVETIDNNYKALIEGVKLGADDYLPINSFGAEAVLIIKRAVGENHSPAPA